MNLLEGANATIASGATTMIHENLGMTPIYLTSLTKQATVPVDIAQQPRKFLNTQSYNSSDQYHNQSQDLFDSEPRPSFERREAYTPSTNVHASTSLGESSTSHGQTSLGE